MIVTTLSSRVRLQSPRPDDEEQPTRTAHRQAAGQRRRVPRTARAASDHHAQVRVVCWQVFGLAGEPAWPPVFLLAVASQNRSGFSACDGARSHLPLRGSPGLTPGSLLRHPTWRAGRTSYETRPYLVAPARPITYMWRVRGRRVGMGAAGPRRARTSRVHVSVARPVWVTPTTCSAPRRSTFGVPGWPPYPAVETSVVCCPGCGEQVSQLRVLVGRPAAAHSGYPSSNRAAW